MLKSKKKSHFNCVFHFHSVVLLTLAGCGRLAAQTSAGGGAGQAQNARRPAPRTAGRSGLRRRGAGGGAGDAAGGDDGVDGAARAAARDGGGGGADLLHGHGQARGGRAQLQLDQGGVRAALGGEESGGRGSRW
jgi:hypothetical protein